MANKKREFTFVLNDDDYKAFGKYRILHTEGGRRLVSRQRATYLICGILIALLFTVFKVDRGFTIFAYIVAAVIGVGGLLFADKAVLRQQNKVLDSNKDNIDRLHPEESSVAFGDEEFTTRTDEDRETFTYADIHQVDMTDDGIYVWMSETMIMPIPLRAFKSREEMEETYNWLHEKTGLE